LRRTAPENLSGKKISSWDEIYDDNSNSYGGTSSTSILHCTLNLLRDTSSTALLHATPTASSNASELVNYLDCDTVS
jgi:hypothetical protein